MQSAPERKSFSAICGEIPVINDAFSPFTTQKSIFFASLNFQSARDRYSAAVGLVISPITSIFKAFSFLSALAVKLIHLKGTAATIATVPPELTLTDIILRSQRDATHE